MLAEKIGRAADRTESMELQIEITVRLENSITQDEIDNSPTHGSGASQGFFRIYDYFKEGHDSKNNATFLKDEYGTGD